MAYFLILLFTFLGLERIGSTTQRNPKLVNIKKKSASKIISTE